MNKYLNFFSLLMIALLLTGCYSNGAATINKEVTLDNIQLEKLVEYKKTYVGDASKVSAILGLLPANIYRNGISLTENSITANYGINEDIVNDEAMKKLEEYFVTDTPKRLLNNALAFFILVQNVEHITFNIQTEDEISFSTSREELEILFGVDDLQAYANDMESWQKFIEDTIINMPDRINDFVTSKL